MIYRQESDKRKCVKMTQQRRNSSIELLRLICILGIITMHTFGRFYQTATGINLLYGTLINSVFNMGVSIFMLISGYYGIKFSIEKVIKIEIMVLTYSILDAMLSYVITGRYSLWELPKAVFPIATRKYWYLSVYVVFCFFSQYINLIPIKLSKRKFSQFLILLFVFFSIMPTITYYEILGDGGKGVVNMLLVYLIGRYIRIYNINLERKKLAGFTFFVVGIGTLLNYLCAQVCGGVGVMAPFARDNSITIVLGSIGVFLIFLSWNFYSAVINYVASYVLAIYIIESPVRKILDVYIDWSTFADQWNLFAVITVYATSVMGVCIIIEFFRRSTLGIGDKYICKGVKRCVDKLTRQFKDTFICET